MFTVQIGFLFIEWVYPWYTNTEKKVSVKTPLYGIFPITDRMNTDTFFLKKFPKRIFNSKEMYYNLTTSTAND